MESKYNCKICNYHCGYKSHYELHKKSWKHQHGGVNKPRKDKGKRLKKDGEYVIHVCGICKYTTKSASLYKHHNLKYHTKIENVKNVAKYYCKNCNFGSMFKKHYDRHLETNKHKLKSKIDSLMEK
jgi:hypothetical protein